jgi:hypothetical protein
VVLGAVAFASAWYLRGPYYFSAKRWLDAAGRWIAEYHLFVGKCHLNLGQNDLALPGLRAAAATNPDLPFVHFNLGMAY